MRFIKIIALTILLLIPASNASADIIVSFSPSTPSPLVAGSSGVIDVLIASDSGTDLLDQFLVDIVLTPVTGPAGGLVFSPLQSELFVTDPNYIFFNRSESNFLGAPVGAVNPGGDIYSAYDATDDGTAVPPDPRVPAPILVPAIGNEALLFRLDLDAITAGTYEIDISPLSQFVNDLGSDISFISTSRLLTVNAAPAAVPEPGSVLLLSVGAVIGAVRYRRRKQAQQAVQESKEV